MAASPTPTSPPACGRAHRARRGRRPSSTRRAANQLRRAARRQPFLEDIRGKLFHGQAVDKYRQRKENGRRRHARAEQERAQDAAWANKTVMRAERMRMLQEFGDGDGAPRVPDGAVEAAPLRLCASADGAAASAVADSADAPAEPELHEARSCYTCKARFRKLHAFYAQCPECAALNWAKREQSSTCAAASPSSPARASRSATRWCSSCSAPARRCVATTPLPRRRRAPASPPRPTSPEWRDRLQVVGLDLRDLRALERSAPTWWRRSRASTSSSTTRARRCAARRATTRR